MIESDKQEFKRAMEIVGKIYDKSTSDVGDKLPVYWELLKHRDISAIKSAINSHGRDPDRGRFFPKPADIEHQIPKQKELWLDPEEAWAMCPKSESDSAAMCAEIAQALLVANDLIDAGDMIAARMSFKAAYSRLVAEAKAENRVPLWYASLGFDRGGRHLANVKVVEMNNLALPMDQRKALPTPRDQPDFALEKLMLNAPKSTQDKEKIRQNIATLNQLTGRSSTCN